MGYLYTEKSNLQKYFEDSIRDRWNNATVEYGKYKELDDKEYAVVSGTDAIGPAGDLVYRSYNNKSYNYYRVIFDESARNKVINPTKTTGEIYGIAIRELYLFDSEDNDFSIGDDVVQTADSYYKTGFDACYAFDRDPSTEWGSKDAVYPQHWLCVSNPGQKILKSIGIIPRNKFVTIGEPNRIIVQGGEYNYPYGQWENLAVFDNLLGGWVEGQIRKLELKP